MIFRKKTKFSIIISLAIFILCFLFLIFITYRAYEEYKFFQLTEFLKSKADEKHLNTSEIVQYANYNGYTLSINYHNVKEAPHKQDLPITIFEFDIIYEDFTNTAIIYQSIEETEFSQDLVLEINTKLITEFTTFLSIIIAIIGIGIVIVLSIIYNHTTKKYIAPINKLSKTLIDLKRVRIDDPNNLYEIEKVIKALNKKVDNYLSYRNNIITIITHELKSPLNIINSAILSRKYRIEPFDDEEEVYKEIDQQIKYMLDVIDITLNIFELEEYEMIEFDARKEIEDVLESFLNIFEANNIKVITDFKDNFMIYGNPRIFKIVVNNLLNNTAKYGSNHLEIIIENQSIYFINKYKNTSEHGTQLGLKLSSQILKTMKLKLKHEYINNEFIAEIKK